MRKPLNREILIEKATGLFYKKGYAYATVRDIVKASGLTNAALYNHFKDKDSLLYTIIERTDEELLELLKEVEQKYDHPLERLKEMIYRETCFFERRKREAKLYLDEQHLLNSNLKRKVRKRHRAIYDCYMKQFRDLESMGLIRPMNKVVLSFCCIAMINWTYRWFKENGGMKIEDVANTIVDTLLNGILMPETLAICQFGKGHAKQLIET